MTTFRMFREKFTKCDSGETLNPFLHVFLFVTLVFSVAFVFFGHTETVQAAVLFQETASIGNSFVNAWGFVGMIVIVLHTIAFWVRGRAGINLMRLCIFGGFYVWLWAAVIYLSGGFLFQFLVTCVPNLYFWVWYALEWSKRKRGERVAFV